MFGSLLNASIEAGVNAYSHGLPDGQMHKVRKMSNDQILEDIIRIHDASKRKNLSHRVYKKQGGLFGKKAMNLRFGGWNKAKLAAGLDIRQRREFTTGELVDNYQTAYNHFGRLPTIGEMKDEPSMVNGDFYRRKWGTWSNARREMEMLCKLKPRNLDQTKKEKVDFKPIIPVELKHNVPPRLKLEMLAKLESRVCRFCSGVKGGIIADHLAPWSKGGITIGENLAPLCGECSIARSNRPFDGDHGVNYHPDLVLYDTKEKTQLMMSVLFCRYNPVRYLIATSAGLDIRGTDGREALQAARSQVEKNSEEVNKAKVDGVIDCTAEIAAKFKASVKIVQLLLDAGAPQ